jgi:hypothetical protein
MDEGQELRRTPAPHILALIHPTTWKKNSAKYVYEIVHTLRLMTAKLADSPGRAPNPKPHILWCWIKMQRRG